MDAMSSGARQFVSTESVLFIIPSTKWQALKKEGTFCIVELSWDLVETPIYAPSMPSMIGVIDIDDHASNSPGLIIIQLLSWQGTPSSK